MRFAPFALIVPLAMISIAMAAQPAGVPPVPADLSTQQTRALNNERAKVVAEGEKLQLAVEDHHAKCAHVGLPLPSGQTPEPNAEALKQQCDADQTEINKRVKQYAADAMAYRRALDAAVAATSSAQNAYPARVVLKGGVHLVGPSGERALTSSSVVRLTTGERITTAPHARAAFQLPDKSVFVLGAESEVVLQTMVNSPTPSQRRISLQLVKGAMRWTSGTETSGGAGNTTIVLAPGTINAATCDVQTGMSADGGGYVVVFKGQARIETNKNTGLIIKVKPNEMTTYTSAGSFSPVTPLQPQEIRAL